MPRMKMSDFVLAFNSVMEGHLQVERADNGGYQIVGTSGDFVARLPPGASEPDALVDSNEMSEIFRTVVGKSPEAKKAMGYNRTVFSIFTLNLERVKEAADQFNLKTQVIRRAQLSMLGKSVKDFGGGSGSNDGEVLAILSQSGDAVGAIALQPPEPNSTMKLAYGGASEIASGLAAGLLQNTDDGMPEPDPQLQFDLDNAIEDHELDIYRQQTMKAYETKKSMRTSPRKATGVALRISTSENFTAVNSQSDDRAVSAQERTVLFLPDQPGPYVELSLQHDPTAPEGSEEEITTEENAAAMIKSFEILGFHEQAEEIRRSLAEQNPPDQPEAPVTTEGTIPWPELEKALSENEHLSYEIKTAPNGSRSIVVQRSDLTPPGEEGSRFAQVPASRMPLIVSEDPFGGTQTLVEAEAVQELGIAQKLDGELAGILGPDWRSIYSEDTPDDPRREDPEMQPVSTDAGEREEQELEEQERAKPDKEEHHEKERAVK